MTKESRRVCKPTAKSGQSESVEILPALEGPGLATLQSLLSRSHVYLEYGCGGSTLMAATDPKRVVISVDSHPEWINKVRAAVAQSAQETATIHLLTAQLGPVVQWGYPATHRRFRSWHSYPLMPWQFCERSVLQPDLVFIDGRFRVASFCASYLAAEPGTRILFDDYTVRPPLPRGRRFAGTLRLPRPNGGVCRASAERLGDRRFSTRALLACAKIDSPG